MDNYGTEDQALRALRKANLLSNRQANEQRNSGLELNNIMQNGSLEALQKNLGQLAHTEGHLPKTAHEYLDQLNTIVNTNEIMEIVQIFSHSTKIQTSNKIKINDLFNGENSSNDYVVIVLQLKSLELKKFYGNSSYLVQAWKNKSRLYQHVHDYKIREIYLNKTEFAYNLQLPEKKLAKQEFDTHLNFIFVVQPFSQLFARVLDPFEDDDKQEDEQNEDQEDKVQLEEADYQQNSVLFISSEYLIVAKDNDIKYVLTEALQLKLELNQTVNSSDLDNSFQTAIQVKYYADNINHIINKYNKKTQKKRPNQDYSETDKSLEMSFDQGQLPYNTQQSQYQKDQQTLKRNQGIYPYKLSDYENKCQVQQILFEYIMLPLGLKVLRLDQAQVFGDGEAVEIDSFIQNLSMSDKMAVLVYAAENSLKISIYKLKFATKEEKKEYQDAVNTSFQEGGLQFEEDDLIEREDNSKDFELIQKVGKSEQNDKYIEMQHLIISQNQTITALKTLGGKLDLFININRSSWKCTRFSDEILKKDYDYPSQIKRFQFGSTKFNVEFGNGNSFQFSVNFQTSQVQIQGSPEEKKSSFIGAILDEQFFDDHVQIFDDMKVRAGIVYLVHGQMLSMYDSIKNVWFHYFNRTQIAKSTQDTQILSFLINGLDEVFERSSEVLRNQLHQTVGINATNIYKQLSDAGWNIEKIRYCFFNRKTYEIKQIIVTAGNDSSSEDFEVIIRMMSGQIRKLNGVYQQNLISMLKSSTANQLIRADGGMANFLKESLISFAHKIPKLTASPYTTMDWNSAEAHDKPNTLDLFEQLNWSQYEDQGILQQKIYLNHWNTSVNPGFCQELFAIGQNEQNSSLVKFLLKIDTASGFGDVVYVPVQNLKINQLCLYSPSTQSLYCIRVEIDQEDDIFTSSNLKLNISELLSTKTNSKNVAYTVPNFDYSPNKKYFAEGIMIYFSKRGNLAQLDLTSGQVNCFDFNKEILEDSIVILPGKKLFYKSTSGFLHFIDLNWITKQDQSQQSCANTIALLKSCSKVKKNQISLFNRIEFDCINREIAVFTAPGELCLLPDLSKTSRVLRGSRKFQDKFLGYSVDRDIFFKFLPHEAQNQALRHKLATLQKSQHLGRYLCPSDYQANICALDSCTNTINVWNVGTGKIISQSQLLDNEYEGYKEHTSWQDTHLIFIDEETLNIQHKKQRGMETIMENSSKQEIRSPKLQYQNFKQGMNSIWKKIRILKNDVQVEKMFYHDYKQGSKIYVNDQNDLLLEFWSNQFDLYQIKDNCTKSTQIQQRMILPINSPVYFSQDFRKFISFENSQKADRNKTQYTQESRFKLQLYDIQDLKTNRLTDIHLPKWNEIKKNENGLPYIQIRQSDQIQIINSDDVEVIIPITDREKLINDQSAVVERYLTGEKLKYRTYFDPLNFDKQKLGSLSESTLFDLRCNQVQQLNTDLKVIQDLKTGQIHSPSGQISYESVIESADQDAMIGKQDQVGQSHQYLVTAQTDTLRQVSTFSFFTWRILELLVSDDLSICNLTQDQLQQLLKVILPDGSTLMSKLVNQSNLKHLDVLLKCFQKQDCTLQMELVPDLRGVTVLHECVTNTYTKVAEELLEILGKQPLGNHFQLIEDILTELIETCPMAVSKYFSSRMIPFNWSLKYTQGDINLADKEVQFCVYSNSLSIIDESILNKKLFKEDKDQGKQKHLPMEVLVFDFPGIHHFQSQTGKKILEALNNSDDIEIFTRPFVQALLEYQWPATRRAILIRQLLPYLVFLIVFNYYVLYWFEQSVQLYNDGIKNIGSNVEGYILKITLIAFSFYFGYNELQQFVNEQDKMNYFLDVWNYLDLFPLIFVDTAIVISEIVPFRNQDLLHLQRYLHAVASLLIWLKIMYFLRVFRPFGHLIQAILEVLQEIRVFLIVLFLVLIAFSGSFFILAQNNTGEDIFTESYIHSVQKMFELMLGNFETDKFGKVGFRLVYFMFMFAALLLIVIMLNLLIAIISDTFSKVQEHRMNKMYQQFSQLIVENQHLIPFDIKAKYDSSGNYLFIAQTHQ